MQVEDLLKISLEYSDNKNLLLIKFFKKFDIDNHDYKIEKEKEQFYINIYLKKKIIAKCKINKLFDYIDKYNVLYWDWANVNTSYYNLDVKKLWEYGFNLINSENLQSNDNSNLNKFLRIVFLNSGLIINNNLTMNIIISLISYILKKSIVCFKYNSYDNNFKLFYEDGYINRQKDNYIYSYYYSITDLQELKENKFIDFK